MLINDFLPSSQNIIYLYKFPTVVGLLERGVQFLEGGGEISSMDPGHDFLE